MLHFSLTLINRLNKTKINKGEHCSINVTPQHLKTGTNIGMGQETHTQTNRARRQTGSKLKTIKIISVLEHRLGGERCVLKERGLYKSTQRAYSKLTVH